jgi:hypothetical protein
LHIKINGTLGASPTGVVPKAANATVPLEVEGVQEGFDLVAAPAQDVEPSQPALVATHDLTVDQAGPHLEVVHGLDHQREPVRPVVAPAGNEPDTDWIAAGVSR